MVISSRPMKSVENLQYVKVEKKETTIVVKYLAKERFPTPFSPMRITSWSESRARKKLMKYCL